MVALIVFTITTLEIAFGQKILFDRRGLFGGNVFKNPATHRKNKKGKGQETLIMMPLIEKHQLRTTEKLEYLRVRMSLSDFLILSLILFSLSSFFSFFLSSLAPNI